MPGHLTVPNRHNDRHNDRHNNDSMQIGVTKRLRIGRTKIRTSDLTLIRGAL